MIITLQSLAVAATEHGAHAAIVETGGGVVALALTVNGTAALVALDYGHESGSEWSVSFDGADRERFGEVESVAPVTSDADQTIADALAWIAHVTTGAEIADGDMGSAWPAHGARVAHRNGSQGTAVGDQRPDSRWVDDATVIGVVWDDSPDTVDTVECASLIRPTY